MPDKDMGMCPFSRVGNCGGGQAELEVKTQLIYFYLAEPTVPSSSNIRYTRHRVRNATKTEEATELTGKL